MRWMADAASKRHPYYIRCGALYYGNLNIVGLDPVASFFFSTHPTYESC